MSLKFLTGLNPRLLGKNMEVTQVFLAALQILHSFPMEAGGDNEEYDPDKIISAWSA